jgi:hypothetical protein
MSRISEFRVPLKNSKGERDLSFGPSSPRGTFGLSLPRNRVYAGDFSLAGGS